MGVKVSVTRCALARIGEPSWIYHQPVEALVYGPIDVINRLAFNVAIENVEDVAMLPGVTLQRGVELGGRCGARSRARAARGRSSSRRARVGSSLSHPRRNGAVFNAALIA